MHKKMSMHNPSQQPNPNTNPVLAYYQEWADKTPYVTRSSVVSILAISLISWVIFDANSQLGVIPYFTIQGFEVYRILTSPLVGNSFFSAILICLFFPVTGGRLENSLGSSAYIALMGLLSILTNVIFILLCYLLFFSGIIQAIFWNCSGFWNIIFGLITIECLQMPDVPRQFLFIPVDIPSKYFPLVLYGFFSIFNYNFDIGSLVAIFVGYLYSKGYLDRLRLTSYYLEQLESPNGMLHGISRSYGWVLAGGALGHDAWIPVNNREMNDSSHYQAATAPRATAGGGVSSARTIWQSFGEADATETSTTSAGRSEAFTGSGRTLSAGGSTTSVTTGVSKEVLAQRRLAALEKTSAPQATKEVPLTAATHSSSNDNKSPAQTLVDMGFPADRVNAALQQVNGDFDRALQLLTV